MCLNGIMRKKVYNIDGNKKMSFLRTFRSLYKKMASWEGFEPPTDRLEGDCSIQLSYQDS